MSEMQSYINKLYLGFFFLNEHYASGNEAVKVTVVTQGGDADGITGLKHER